MVTSGARVLPSVLLFRGKFVMTGLLSVFSLLPVKPLMKTEDDEGHAEEEVDGTTPAAGAEGESSDGGADRYCPEVLLRTSTSERSLTEPVLLLADICCGSTRS